MRSLKVRLTHLALGIVVLTGLHFHSVPVYAQTRPQLSPSPSAVTATTNRGPHFFVDETVVLTENLTGDVYVVGKTVRVENRIDGDLLVAGAQVVITGTVTQDVRATGANVDLRGQVGGNVTAAAATLNLDRQAQIGGSLVSAAGTTDIYGQVMGNSRLSGSVMTLGGRFGQNVDVRGEKLEIQKESHIAGSLRGELAQEPSIAEGVIAGETTVRQVSPKQPRQDTTESLLKAAVGWVVVVGLMLWVTGAILLALFPRALSQASQNLRSQPFASLGWGISHLILTPIVAILLLITIIGIPLGILVALVYFMSLVVGGVVVSYALGQKLYKTTETSYITQIGQLALGTWLLKIVEVIPVIGWLIKLVTLSMGMGALVITLKNSIFDRQTNEFQITKDKESQSTGIHSSERPASTKTQPQRKSVSRPKTPTSKRLTRARRKRT